MPVTMKRVRALLAPDEPDYSQAAQIGRGALTHLRRLIRGMDPFLAAKATYLVSLIPDDLSSDILAEASKSNIPEVRVAAAAGAKNIESSVASSILSGLLEDQDVGVRKFALRAIPNDAPLSIRTKIRALKLHDPNPAIRKLSDEVLERLIPIP